MRTTKSNLLLGLLLSLFLFSGVTSAASLSDAKALYTDGKLSQALTEVDRLLQENARDTNALFLKAQLQYELGKRASAIATYRAIIKQSPQQLAAYNNLATIYAQHNNLRAASEVLEQAMRVDPVYATIYDNLRAVYWDMSKRHVRAALKLKPVNSGAKLLAIKPNSPLPDTAPDPPQTNSSSQKTAPLAKAEAKPKNQDEKAAAKVASTQPETPPKQATQPKKAEDKPKPKVEPKAVTKPQATNEQRIRSAFDSGTKSWSARNAVQYVTHASLDYEKRLIDSLSHYQNGNKTEVEAALRRYVKDYPNSQVAQLLLADLLAARSGIIAPDAQYQSQFNHKIALLQLEGLRDEINLRWNQIAESNPAKQGLVPASILKLDEKHQTIVFVDTQAARLYVFENNQGVLQHVTDYYTTIGLKGVHKRKEDDKRTPIGVYNITSFIPDEELPPLYGAGALPINYPNELDRRYKRTGSGIWIHGTHPESFNRVPYASDGCVALSNPEFTRLRSVIDYRNKTPVVISDNVNWVKTTNSQYADDLLANTLYAWKNDWASMNLERYLSYYSKPKYKSARGQTYSAWAARKRQVSKAKTRVTIAISGVSAYLYPGEKNMLVVEFTQDYQSNNFDSETNKKQYWLKNPQGKWEIIYEGQQ